MAPVSIDPGTGVFTGMAPMDLDMVVTGATGKKGTYSDVFFCPVFASLFSISFVRSIIRVWLYGV